MAHVAKLLDRECPRCRAAAAIKCRDPRRPKKTAAREHVARGWLDRPCATCHAQPGERCVTPTGREAPTVHRPRWEQPRLTAQRYGYVWVAPDEHELEQPQRDALSAARCARLWADRPQAVGADHPRAERAQLLAYLQPRDVLVIWRLDRLARSATELADIAAVLRARKVALCSITENLDSTRPGGEQLFAAIAAIAQLQPSTTGAGRPGTARSRARTGGRPRLLDERAHAAVRAMYEAGQHTAPLPHAPARSPMAAHVVRMFDSLRLPPRPV
ncbi:MAG: recombinase family protein [Actinobacteria bacterium]|nr:recombinase family protein [Actinomycetota bacterium]